MMRRKGLYLPNGQFISFAEAAKAPALDAWATRSRATGRADMGTMLPNPDAVLKKLGKDIQAYKELSTDPLVGAAIRRRKAAVRAMEWGIERGEASGKTTKAIERLIGKLPVKRIIGDIVNACFYGYQPFEVMWGQPEKGGACLPVDVQSRPADWFFYNDSNEPRFKTATPGGDPLPERKFIIARQDASYDNPYGVADLAMCFWPVTFKRGGLKFWVQFTEKYGTPWLVGKHPRSATDEEIDNILDSLEQMIQDAVCAIPDDSSVEIKEATSKQESVEAFERLLYYCRSEISIALLGQNQTTEADSNRASATAGLEVTADLRDSDAALVCEAVNELVRYACDLIDGPDSAAPSFSLWEQESVDKDQAERDATLSRDVLIPAGKRLSQTYLVRTYGMEDDDIEDIPTSTPVSSPEQGQGDPVATATKGKPKNETSADFAEADVYGADIADQAALDDLVDSMDGEMQKQAEQLLAPLFVALRQGQSPAEILPRLAEMYPQMDGKELQDSLSQMIFMANLWGNLNA